ncbi:MAG: hypothetical protein IID45_08910, partial [Planctomycetes bacterium]|nr:hypothetical protein [Planctomycetota bacterium]
MLNGKRLTTSGLKRWSWFLLIVMAAFSVTSTITTTTSIGTSAAVAADDDESEEGGNEGESFLSWLIRANGWFFGPVFLLLSFVMIALVI